MEHPAFNRHYHTGPSRTFIEGLKEIPSTSDRKTRLQNIPREHYLDSENLPRASAALKDRLKRIPGKRKGTAMAWRVAAAVAGLCLLSLPWWPNESVKEMEPQVNRLTPISSLPLLQVPQAPSLEFGGLAERTPVVAMSPFHEPKEDVQPTESGPRLEPLNARRATPLVNRSRESKFLLAAEMPVPNERKVPITEDRPLRTRFAKTGEQLLARSGGRWGWSIAPENDPIKFRVHVNKNQWVALRRRGSR